VYRGEAEFVASSCAFVRDGLDAGEPVLVAVPPAKIDLLGAALGGAARRVRFMDLSEVGRNPARIIPVWRRFVDEHPGAVRGLAEPEWSGRRAVEVAESQLHDALLNLAFPGDPRLLMRCSYDADVVDPSVLVAARRTHPYAIEEGDRRQTWAYTGPQYADAVFGRELPEPASRAERLWFGPGGLAAVRELVEQHTQRAGLSAAKTANLTLAVHEIASNSLDHGAANGALRVWVEPDGLVCEVRDDGQIDQILMGRIHPVLDAKTGWGIWMVNQLCDLVQLRSSAAGTVVRMHMWL
jgi:anti-sigma regulatory factor (Ser/Thr protein kinase)